MSINSLPTVIIEADAWRVISEEVTYWAEMGLRRGRAPMEAVFYPLTAITLKRTAARTPFDLIELDDVKHFTVCSAFVPPHKFADYTSVSAQFSATDGNVNLMNRVFQQGVLKKILRQPQLRYFGPGHSHPFAIDNTAPSTTDVECHIRPYRHRNEELLGCRFSLALIVVRKRGSKDWQACAYAMDGNEIVRNLGIAAVRNSSYHIVQQARMRPFYRTRRGRKWEAEQRAQFVDGIIEIERWAGGWTTYLIREDEKRANLFMLPPRFPSEPPLVRKITLGQRTATEFRVYNRGRGYHDYNFKEEIYEHLCGEC